MINIKMEIIKVGIEFWLINSLGETTANSVLSSKETVTPDMALEAIANHLNNELRAQMLKGV